MFQFPRFPPAGYGLARRWQDMTPAWFPNSGTPGSKLVCSSPGRFAADRALHRLSLPRHPPRALCSLTPSRQQIRSGLKESSALPTGSHDYAVFKVLDVGDTNAEGAGGALCGRLTATLLAYSGWIPKRRLAVLRQRAPISGRRVVYPSLPQVSRVPGDSLAVFPKPPVHATGRLLLPVAVARGAAAPTPRSAPEQGFGRLLANRTRANRSARDGRPGTEGCQCRR